MHDDDDDDADDDENDDYDCDYDNYVAGDVDNDGGTKKELSYPEIVAMIIETDGVAGLLGRGLQTRLLTNAIQGGVFSVLWRYFQQVGGPQ